MPDVVISGASRGIGRALALELAGRGERLVVTARDGERLRSLVAEIERKGGRALAIEADLSSIHGAEELARRLAGELEPGAMLVHNAGIWPTRRVVVDGGLEEAFVVNHLAGVVLVRALLGARLLRRIAVVSAGLIGKGRFDPSRTPTGADFSRLRTYATTKLCFAVEMRAIAREHPDVDVVVMHPGVVRTDLGATDGVVGALLSLVKRTWEPPERCAERLARILSRERWSPPGDPAWLVEETEEPWPAVASDPETRAAVHEATERWLQKLADGRRDAAR